MSVRAGAFPRRMRKRVYLPYRPGFVTRMRNWMPARKLRCIVRSRTGASPRATRSDTALRARARGQPLPLQRAATAVPAGACTDKRRMRAPRRVSEPAIRTTGNGVMNDTEVPSGAEPLDWKPAPSPPAAAGGVPGAAGVGALTGAVVVDLGVVVVLGLGLGLVRGFGRGRTVVVGRVVVVGTTVLDPVEVDSLVLVPSSGTLVPPPSGAVSEPGWPSDSCARLATGPTVVFVAKEFQMDPVTFPRRIE